MVNPIRLLPGILLSFVLWTLALVPVSAEAAQIRPLADKVIVERVDKRRSGGIIIPESAKDKAREGLVVGVGPGRNTESDVRIPVDVRVGDVVLFGKYSGTEVNIDGEEFLIMRESDILAIVGPDD